MAEPSRPHHSTRLRSRPKSKTRTRTTNPSEVTDAGRPAPTPKAERRPLPIGQVVWLDRDGVRTRQVVVGYRGKVVLLGGAA